MCKDHPEEEVSYYCFKCLENICPECAIHGIPTIIQGLIKGTM